MKFKESKRYNPAKEEGYDAIEVVFEDEKDKHSYIIPGDVFEELLETKGNITPQSITTLMEKYFNQSSSIISSPGMFMYTKEIVDSRPTRSFLIELIQEKLRLLETLDKASGNELGSDKSFEGLELSYLKKILSELTDRTIRQMFL